MTFVNIQVDILGSAYFICVFFILFSFISITDAMTKADDPYNRHREYHIFKKIGLSISYEFNL